MLTLSYTHMQNSVAMQTALDAVKAELIANGVDLADGDAPMEVDSPVKEKSKKDKSEKKSKRKSEAVEEPAAEAEETAEERAARKLVKAEKS